VKDYNRGRRAKFTSLTPLNRLVDAARPESDEARTFGRLVDALLADPAKSVSRDAIAARLRQWQDDARDVQAAMGAPLLQDAAPIAQHVALVSSIGLRALDALQKKTPLSLTAEESDGLARAAAPVADVLLMVAPAVKRLADGAKAP
jgi:hexosaminidase